MDSTHQFKIEYNNTLRRVSFPANDSSFSKLKTTIALVLGIPQDQSVTIQYRDEDGDLITINSDLELKEIMNGANKVTRLIISTGVAATSSTATTTDSNQPQQQQQQDEPAKEEPKPEPPKLPFQEVAELLSNPDKVAKLQTMLFTSPVLTESINQAAQIYLNSKGSLAETLAFLHEQIPVMQAVVDEVLQDFPELLPLWRKVFEGCCSGNSGCGDAFPFAAAAAVVPGMMAAFSPLIGSLFASPSQSDFGTPFAGLFRRMATPQQQQQQPKDAEEKTIHFGVVCDGCEAMGQSNKGYICGERFKSQTVPNFDLCESCHSSGLFAETCGPFVSVPVAHQQQQHRGWRRCCAPSSSTCGGKRGQDQAGVHPKAPQPPSTAAATTTAAPAAPASPPEEWVKVQKGQDLMTKWASQLQLLATLGFENIETYAEILEEEKGDMEKTVNRIIRRES